jgi:hypothetical protein
MTIHTAYQALVIWGEFTASGGAPLGPVMPEGFDTSPEMSGAADEKQVADFVERTPGFAIAEPVLIKLYRKSQNNISPAERADLYDFEEALQTAIGQKWATIPRVPTEGPCEKDEIDAITSAVNEAAEGKYPLRWRQRIRERRSA